MGLKMRSKALSRAIETAGGLKNLATPLGITPQAISQWAECPVLRVLEIERLSGVSRHELRPDIYPIDRPPEAIASPPIDFTPLDGQS